MVVMVVQLGVVVELLDEAKTRWALFLQDVFLLLAPSTHQTAGTWHPAPGAWAGGLVGSMPKYGEGPVCDPCTR